MHALKTALKRSWDHLGHIFVKTLKVFNDITHHPKVGLTGRR